MKQHLWTWGGKYFGFRDGDDLRTHFGKHAGRFFGDEVYSSKGKYLGELRNKKFLITNRGKSHYAKAPFSRRGDMGSYGSMGDYGAHGMLGGYEDFPAPEEF